jgi:hypothetical protein
MTANWTLQLFYVEVMRPLSPGGKLLETMHINKKVVYGITTLHLVMPLYADRHTYA